MGQDCSSIQRVGLDTPVRKPGDLSGVGKAGLVVLERQTLRAVDDQGPRRLAQRHSASNNGDWPSLGPSLVHGRRWRRGG